MIEMPDLKIDRDGDGPDALVTLQQGDNPPMWVSMHPCQVRVLAERIGLLPGSSQDAERDLVAEVRVLQTRVQFLANCVEVLISKYPEGAEPSARVAGQGGEAGPDLAQQQSGATDDQLPLGPDWRL